MRHQSLVICFRSMTLNAGDKCKVKRRIASLSLTQIAAASFSKPCVISLAIIVPSWPMLKYRLSPRIIRCHHLVSSDMHGDCLLTSRACQGLTAQHRVRLSDSVQFLIRQLGVQWCGGRRIRQSRWRICIAVQSTRESRLSDIQRYKYAIDSCFTTLLP